jgi:hypothetical protein
MSPKKRIDIMIEPEQLQLLQLLQHNTGATISESIRRAIDRYMQSDVMPAVERETARRAAQKREAITTKKKKKR